MERRPHVISYTCSLVKSSYIQEIFRKCFSNSFITISKSNTIFCYKNQIKIRILKVHQVITEDEEKSGTKFKLSFPNCGKYAFVTLEITSKVLKHLEM